MLLSYMDFHTVYLFLFQYFNCNMNDCFLSLQIDLANLYIKTGAKNIPTVFLLTDAQVPDERFLVLINDLLASGD